MPQEPKRRHSKARQGKRRASIELKLPQAVVCKNCGEVILPHRVCTNCGYYRGRLVIQKRKNEKPA